MTETTLDELTTVEEPRDFAGDDEDDDDDDGPPPGFNCISRPTATDSEEKIVYGEEEDEEEEAQGDEEEDMDRAPPGWSSIPATLKPPDKEVRIHHQSGPKTPPSSQLLPHVRSQPQAPASLPSDKGQMVCGACLQLLAYPRGVKYAKCSCCQTVNLVLEANQVGQVKCGGCAALLMYPHGAPSVKCCSCRFVRHWSSQQAASALYPTSSETVLPELCALEVGWSWSNVFKVLILI